MQPFAFQNLSLSKRQCLKFQNVKQSIWQLILQYVRIQQHFLLFIPPIEPSQGVTTFSVLITQLTLQFIFSFFLPYHDDYYFIFQNNYILKRQTNQQNILSSFSYDNYQNYLLYHPNAKYSINNQKKQADYYKITYLQSHLSNRHCKERTNTKKRQQQMKLKQSYSLNKKIYLPPLKTIESNHITPKNKPVNHSLPKILALNISQMQSKIMSNHNRNVIQNRKPLKDRLKGLYNKKRGHLQFNNIQNETCSKTIEQADITNNFQKQIQKNLVEIKKAKESNRKEMSKKMTMLDRYLSPRCSTQSENEVYLKRGQKSLRIETEQTVFSNINQIMKAAQSKTPSAPQQERILSLKSYIHNDKNIQRKSVLEKSRKKMKTQITETYQRKNSSKLPGSEIKHNNNYHQWKRLSIESLNNNNIRYQNTSYEIQTDRLESIRSKNDHSLQKYFEGKEYLQRLINCRQSSAFASRKG